MMNPKRYRVAIEHSLSFAQSHSSAPVPHPDPYSYQARIHELEADRDRLMSFFAALAGTVQDDDSELAGKLVAFLHAKPGVPC